MSKQAKQMENAEPQSNNYPQDALLSGATSFGKVAWLIASALMLSGCVVSQEPLLTDSQPLFGTQFEVHLYENLQDGKAGDFHVSTYRWDSGKYVRVSGLVRDATNFVARELRENDFIVQGSAGVDKVFNYWVGRRVAAGVYLVFTVSENDVDATVRNTACAKAEPEGICRVETYDHLVTLALGTASKPPQNPALIVVLPKSVVLKLA
jgi:hypothetical protein